MQSCVVCMLEFHGEGNYNSVWVGDKVRCSQAVTTSQVNAGAGTGHDNIATQQPSSS